MDEITLTAQICGRNRIRSYKLNAFSSVRMSVILSVRPSVCQSKIMPCIHFRLGLSRWGLLNEGESETDRVQERRGLSETGHETGCRLLQLQRMLSEHQTLKLIVTLCLTRSLIGLNARNVMLSI